MSVKWLLVWVADRLEVNGCLRQGLLLHALDLAKHVAQLVYRIGSD